MVNSVYFYYLKSERCAPLYRSARTYQNCKCWEYELQRRSTRSNKSIQVLPEEEQIFETIASKGVTVTAQLVPNDPVVDFMKNYAAKTVRLRKNIFKFRRKFQCI